MVAAVATAVEVHISSQVGLLAAPPVYDGIGYVNAAKSTFNILQTRGIYQAPLFHVLSTYFTFAPLWEALLLASFWLLGEGEWQAVTVRFVPTFLLLLLMFWIARRQGRAVVGWSAVLFTVLLPTISVGLRSSGWNYLGGRSDFGAGWYLADLRPDLLFAVLLLWAVVPLIEGVDTLDGLTWFTSGTAAALAVLTKPSTTPVLALAGGLTVICLLIVNQRNLLRTVTAAAWGFVPFVVLLIPWALVGGPGTVAKYLFHHLTVGRPLWSVPNATFFSEAALYWRYFPFHMGPGEGWLLLGLGLVLWLVRVFRNKKPVADRLLAYLLVAAGLYGLVSATPNKNLFLGLPYYLLLWVFSWRALASFLGAASMGSRIARSCLVLISIGYGVVVVGAAGYALHQWPVENQQGLLENRTTTQRIASDLRSFLGNDDFFMWAPAYGYPATLQYYMMDSEGRYPQTVAVDPTTSPPVAEFLRREVNTCKAIVAYEEDIEEVAKYFSVHPMSYAYWRGISEWVRRPGSPYRPVHTYRLWGRFPDRPVLIHLYVREPDKTLEDGR
jgi:4-amino-4-deoxy-L-arabinose transferase-like glycosyltransferase